MALRILDASRSGTEPVDARRRSFRFDCAEPAKLFERLEVFATYPSNGAQDDQSAEVHCQFMEVGRGDANAARFWVNGDVPPAVAAYLRAVLVRTVEAEEHEAVWPLLSMLYALDEATPAEFKNVRSRSEAEPSLALRHYTDWGRRQAKPAEYAALSVVAPDAVRVADWLRQRVRRHREYDLIYTQDQETLLVLAQAADIAVAAAHSRARRQDQLQLPVVLLGESGTGKELLAKAMHQIHMRALAVLRKEPVHPSETFDDSFGPINCGGLPAKLVESELFGHSEGSFTGAIGRRDGIIPRCSSGTVFLDEIGDTPMKVQLRLLRFLNDGEVRPVGKDKPDHHFPWVIAATHRDLAAYVADGKFRDDLLNRLNGHALHLKPLKGRGDDALGALDACIKRHVDRELTINISIPAERALRDYSWKGNLRVVDQFARRIVQARQPRGKHLSFELRDLPHEVLAKYFESRSYADVLVDQYAEEVRTLNENERAAMRDSLIPHYADVLGTMVPEVRFVRTVAKLAASDVAQKLFDDPKDHPKLIRAVDALAARITRHQVARFRRALYAIDGLELPHDEPGAELIEQLPSWLRKMLALIEEFAGNPVVSTPLRNFEMWLEKIPAPVRAVVMDLLASIAEEARKPDVDAREDGIVAREVGDPHWKDIKKNKTLFDERLRKAGSIAEMARELRLDPKTVSTAARRLGAADSGTRKKSGGSSGKSPKAPKGKQRGER